MEQPFDVDDKQYYLSCSIGAAFFPSQGRDQETLFKRAEIAVREAKSLGGSQVAYYTTNREQHDAKTLSLVSQPTESCWILWACERKLCWALLDLFMLTKASLCFSTV